MRTTRRLTFALVTMLVVILLVTIQKAMILMKMAVILAGPLTVKILKIAIVAVTS